MSNPQKRTKPQVFTATATGSYTYTGNYGEIIIGTATATSTMIILKAPNKNVYFYTF
jgi:hypothetical protein